MPSLNPFKEVMYKDTLFPIANYLDFQSIRQLASTNQYLCNALKQYHFSLLKQIITSFHLDPITLLKILYLTQSVISGSVALWLLKPYTFSPNDIDIYLPRQKSRTIVDLIETHSTYKLLTHGFPSTENYAFNDSIRMVLRLQTHLSNKTINLIVSNTTNALVPLLHFHSTAVMNFISPFRLTCMYPRLTLNSISLINAHSVPPPTFLPEWRQKYVTRGFQIVNSLNDLPQYHRHICGNDPCCPQTVRILDDSYTLTIQFPYSFKPKKNHHYDHRRFAWRLNGAQRCTNGPHNSSHFIVLL